MRISPDDAVYRIRERIDAIRMIRKTPDGLDYYDFIRWCSATWSAIDAIYGSGDPRSEELRTMGLSGCSCNAGVQALLMADTYEARLREYIREIGESGEGPGE